MHVIYKFVFLILLFSFVELSYAIKIDNIKLAFDYMQKQKWDLAIAEAKKSEKTELLKIIQSQKYLDQNSDAAFEERVKFASQNPNWPSVDEIIHAAEKKITSKTKTDVIKNWFDKHDPTTPNGHKFRAYAEIIEYKKSKHKNKEAVAEIVKNGWINGDFSEKEMEFYLRRYHKVLLKEDHAKKVNVLLWRGDIAAAKKMLDFLHPQHRKMFLVRIAAMENLQDAAIIYGKLDEKEKYHSGVLYEYINHKIRQDPKADITRLILHAPNDLENSDRWWKLKSFIVRELINRKNYKDAFLIASKHYSTNPEDKSDAFWMSGWIAFSFLNRPEIAVKYFEKFYQNVKKPNMVSKAAYWIAKSLAATKHKQMAYKWIAKAAAFPETFYGQLANEYMNKKNFHLNINPKLEAKYRAKFENNDLVKALYLLQKYKKYNLAQIYMKSAINHSNHPIEVLLITQIAKEDGIIVANHKNPEYSFPKGRVESSLVYSIIRQESAFNQNAVSEKNARGLMQIRPDTAKILARELKVEYSEAKLTSDVSYNINLGTKYLQNLIGQFNGSYILALCAYNAGPGKAKEWIDRFGDPRKMKSIHDVVNWIELISYGQTREYVQKVLENLQIYRYILKDDNALKIRGDLFR
jgi:soluble lytic murein transglycosylase